MWFHHLNLGQLACMPIAFGLPHSPAHLLPFLLHGLIWQPQLVSWRSRARRACGHWVGKCQRAMLKHSEWYSDQGYVLSLYVILGLERTHDTLTGQAGGGVSRQCPNLGSWCGSRYHEAWARGGYQNGLGGGAAMLARSQLYPLNAIGSICLYGLSVQARTHAHKHTLTPTHSSQTASLWGNSSLAAVMICPIKSAS